MTARINTTTSQARHLLKHTKVGVPEKRKEVFTDADRVWLCENVIELATQNKRLQKKVNRKDNWESSDI